MADDERTRLLRLKQAQAKAKAASQSEYPIMSQVNKGIANTVGGLVDFINPFDEQTGSAVSGLEGLMGMAGIEVAQGDPQTYGQAFARGAGNAAGAMIPAAGAIGAMRGLGGSAGAIASDAYGALVSKGGAATEVLAGGVSDASRMGAKQAGAPEWAQDVAAIAGPAAALPGAIAATKGIARVTPSAIGARQLTNKLAAAVAPYTAKGANEVARKRMVDLAGGEGRAKELAGRISADNEFGLTPAQQTADPNMLAVEQTAASQSPTLRAELESGAARSGDAGRRAVADMGGDVQDARTFYAEQRRVFKEQLSDTVAKAQADADARLRSIGPRRTESDNSLIVNEEITKALTSAREQEAALWGAVPKGARVPTSNTKAKAQELIDKTPYAQRNDIPRTVRDIVEAGDVFGADATVSEMHGAYSELRRVARSARAGNDQNRNLARIADEVAEEILKDLGAVDGTTVAGRKINEARAFSAEMHETFDRGAVGRLLKRTIDGDTAIDPELALNRTVGRAGAQAAVADRQIGTATKGASEGPVEDYIKDRFQNAAISATGEFNAGSALKFRRDNAELLNRYPELKSEITAAVRQRESADQFAVRVAGRIKALETAKRSATEAFLGGSPDKAIKAIFDAKSPERAASQLANAARKDKSGKALAGVKGAFTDYLIGSATKGSQFSGDAMTKSLADPKVKRTLSRVFNQQEMSRLNFIAKQMSKLDTASEAAPSIGSTLSGAQPPRVISFIVRVAAARHGSKMGRGSGGSIQTAQMATTTAQKMLQSLTSDRASQILSDAVTDPDLFKSLLLDGRSVSLDKKVLPRIVPYLVGGSAAGLSE